MYRLLIIVFIFILQTVPAHAKKQELSACSLERRFANTLSTTPLCMATILDQKHIIYNRACQRVANPRGRRATKFNISCANDAVSIELPSVHRSQSKNKLMIVEIKDQLPFLPTKHYNSHPVKNCHIQALKKDIILDETIIE